MVANVNGSLERHPWNMSFSWGGHDRPAYLTTSQVALFDDLGYVVLDGVFSAAEVATLVTELDRFESKADARLRAASEGRAFIAETGAITFAPKLVARSSLLARFVRHPALLGICHDLIGGDVRLYNDQAVYKKPEKPRRFPWHQDNGYVYVEPQAYLTCWIALTDATLENGCPQVATGVHRYGTLHHRYVDPLGWECFTEAPAGTLATAAVRAGGVVVFSSLTPHLTGPNLTDVVRKAYIVQYAPNGAEMLSGEPTEGPPTGRMPASDEATQFAVLLGGQPTEP